MCVIGSESSPGGGGGGGLSPFGVIFRPQLSSLPVSCAAVSETSRVQVPFADSPANADRSNVPRMSSAEPPSLFDTVTDLPDGLVSFTTRSPRYVCWMPRSSCSFSTATSSATSIVDLTVALSAMGAFGCDVFVMTLSGAGGGGGGVFGVPVISTPQLLSVPTSPLALSSTVSFQSPFELSPANADRSNFPLRSSAEPPWRLLMTADFPDGLVSVTTRSPRYVWARSRFAESFVTSRSCSMWIVDSTFELSWIAAFGEAVPVTVSDAARARSAASMLGTATCRGAPPERLSLDRAAPSNPDAAA